MKRNPKLLVIALLIIAFFGSFYGHKRRATKRNYSDFHCFYTAGKRLLNHENIYVLRDQETAEFRYAPIFAVLMSGMALMPEDTADTVWYILNFCLLIISFILLRKIIIPDELARKTKLILYGLTLLGVVRFILHNFDTGQPNILMLFSILAGLYYISKSKELWGGLILAFSIMIKYTPLIFIPYFMLRGKIKLSLIIIGSVVIYLLVPALFTGFRQNLLYIKNLIPFLTNSTILDQFTILDPKNQSLFSAIQRIFTNCILYFYAPPMPLHTLNLSPASINLTFLILASLMYLGILYRPKNTQVNIDYALLLICVVLFNLNAWAHNYLFLSMPYFILIYYLLKNGFKDKTVAVLLGLSYILNFISLKFILGKTLAYKIYFYSPYTTGALVTFFLLLKIKFSKKLV